MKKLLQQSQRFLLSNYGWLIFILLLAAAYVLMQMSNQLGWSNYLKCLGVLWIFFLPQLVFSFFRTILRQSFSKMTYWISWMTVFILYPIGIWLGGVGVNDLGLYIGVINDISIVLPVISFAVLLLELLLLWYEKSGSQRSMANWVLSWSMLRLAVIVVFLFSFNIVFFNNYFQEQITILPRWTAFSLYLSNAIQLFILYLSYYLIYHLHHHFLFNQLLRKKGILFYLMGLVGLLLIFVPIQNTVISWFPVVQELKMHTTGLTDSIFDVLNFTIPLGILILSFPLIVIIEWYRQVNTVTLLEKEKSITELSLLKQQINPHFFFNTLNNLYAMSLTKEEETPETILQLSKLMRYVIYKGQEEHVSLKDEISYLQDYIDLQAIRMHSDIDLRFETDIQDEALEIPPLLFVILIENAFKHGIEPAEKEGFLHIKLQAKNKQIHFECFNSIDAKYQPQKSGIGLENLKRRLGILFPERYKLSLQNNTTEFLATLDLQL